MKLVVIPNTDNLDDYINYSKDYVFALTDFSVDYKKTYTFYIKCFFYTCKRYFT